VKSTDEDSVSLKLKLVVDLVSATTLNQHSKICNWLYNFLLEEALVLRQNFKKNQDSADAKILYTKRGLRNLLPMIKKEKSFLKKVHSSPLKNTALRLSSAISTHQKTKKKQSKPAGFPKFRSWKQKWFSLFYDEPKKGFKIEGNQLILSLGLGEDRKQQFLILDLPDADLLKEKKIRNLRITKEFEEYYAIFTWQKKLPVKKPISKIIALDPNHKNIAYGVDTDAKAIEITAPTWLKTYDKRIDELKSKRDSCLRKAKKLPVLDQTGTETGKTYYLPSKRWKKYSRSLEKAQHKRREQTKTFMFTIAHKLCKEYDCIAIGDYTPHGGGITTKMRRAMNNRSLIGRFKGVLSWVAKKSGKTFLEYKEAGTTRTCNSCLTVVEGGIEPSCRQWQCKECKTLHHRDENSAINGLRKILWDFSTNSETIVSQVPSLGLALIKERWAWCVAPSGILCMPRGQDSEILAAPRN
jgi:putative transposase